VARIDGFPVHRVLSFKEKPDPATAARFLAEGGWLWNAGTFVWRASVLRRAFERHLPGHFAVLEDLERRLAAGEAVTAADYDRFASVPVDTGILEKSDNVEVVPATFTWDDVGSWLAFDRLHPRDHEGNLVRGIHLGVDTRNCLVVSRGHLVATVGVEDMIIIHTPDATLICPKERAEEVREIVKGLEERGMDEYL
jgi:mannose-1-phosphate guanylyltransferase